MWAPPFLSCVFGFDDKPSKVPITANQYESFVPASER